MSDNTPELPPAGWYPDPANAVQERYWDSIAWTHQTRPKAPPVVAPPVGPVGQVGGNYYTPSPAQVQQANETFVQPGTQPGIQGAPRPATQGQYTYQAPMYAPGQYNPGLVADRVPRTADGVPLAGWWWRVLAMLIDGVLLNLVISTATTPIVASMMQDLTRWVEDATAAAELGGALPTIWDPAYGLLRPLLILTAINFAVTVLYGTLFLVWKGGTIGQISCGLRVVPFGKGREHRGLSVGTALLRNVVLQIFAMIPLFSYVNYLAPLWNANRQTFHDMVVKTQVVRIN